MSAFLIILLSKKLNNYTNTPMNILENRNEFQKTDSFFDVVAFAIPKFTISQLSSFLEFEVSLTFDLFKTQT